MAPQHRSNQKPTWDIVFLVSCIASASLREILPEAFGFDSMLCRLSLPLLSALLCPLWLFLLYMMNVIAFALFN